MAAGPIIYLICSPLVRSEVDSINKCYDELSLSVFGVEILNAPVLVVVLQGGYGACVKCVLMVLLFSNINGGISYKGNVTWTVSLMNTMVPVGQLIVGGNIL
ncbi:hypothetical protein TNCV_922901 [Trichonephila clavipes]|nr:hypothetical protein TNCV_922901 [Trichonephila clavipes]